MFAVVTCRGRKWMGAKNKSDKRITFDVKKRVTIEILFGFTIGWVDTLVTHDVDIVSSSASNIGAPGNYLSFLC